MAYKVGISSGWWRIAKDPALLGLAVKAGQFGATGGVQFNQVDLDTILEFLEPDLKKFITRFTKELGIQIGLHGEVQPAPVALESAERRMWEQSHDRNVVTVKAAADLGFVYINIHTSNTVQLIQEEARIRPFGFQFQIVDPFGRPFWRLAEESPAVKNYILRLLAKQGGMVRELQGEEIFRERADKFNKELDEEITREAIRRIHERINQGQTEDTNVRTEYDRVRAEMENSGILRRRYAELWYSVWKDSIFAKYTIEAGEIDAYIAVGAYMIEKNDPIWTNIVGSTSEAGPNASPGDRSEWAYVNKHAQFNAAVAAKYIEGHLTVKDNEFNKKVLEGKSMLEFCGKTGVKILLEMPQSGEGVEGLSRLYNPLETIHLLRKLGSPILLLTIDFEQTMAQRIDIDNDLIAKMPPDFGKFVYLLHLGEPIPYFGTAHIPIAIGGHGQDVLYRWIYALRKTGFKDGVLIFERGGGRSGQGKGSFDVFEESVKAVRQITKYLEQDFNPQELPPEFYGISFENKDVYARQIVSMRDHAWDPLEGLLMQPEEKHGFFSRAAVEKGKGEIWEKRKWR
ncbi:MAG: hypothetical protein HYT72_02590 [Candidatus Aenigmarchaeota archaeon]|nr:hypothetical protein [Candidatus Aenigmarchaeota archaeon]